MAKVHCEIDLERNESHSHETEVSGRPVQMVPLREGCLMKKGTHGKAMLEIFGPWSIFQDKFQSKTLTYY